MVVWEAALVLKKEGDPHGLISVHLIVLSSLVLIVCVYRLCPPGNEAAAFACLRHILKTAPEAHMRHTFLLSMLGQFLVIMCSTARTCDF